MTEGPDALPTPPPASEPTKKAVETEYLILVHDAQRNGWTEGSQITARGAGEAVRRHAEKNGEGTYVAVPARSWKPVKVVAETQTKLKFS